MAARKKADGLAGKPKTAGYRMPQTVGPSWAGSGGITGMPGGFNLRCVDEMRTDPAVSMCLKYKLSPLFAAEIDVQAADPRIRQYIQKQVDKFWGGQSLAVALECYPWGFAGSEATYITDDDGIDHFNGLQPLHAFDVKPYTQHGTLDYIKVARVPPNDRHKGGEPVVLRGAEEDRPAEGTWFVHEPHRQRWYGVSILAAAWLYWRLKTMPDGMTEILFKWLYKHSYSGMVVRHPQHAEYSDGPGDQPQQAQDMARQMAEQAKAGANFALPGDQDEHGNYLWDIVQYGKIEGDASGLVKVVDEYIDKQIQRAMDIPDEVITHQGNTGGYSRSQVAAAAFFLDAERGGNGLLERADLQVFRPLVWRNFGRSASQDYALKLKPLLQPDQPPGGPGAMPQPGPGQSNGPPEQGGQDQDPLAALLGAAGKTGAPAPQPSSGGGVGEWNPNTGARRYKRLSLTDQDGNVWHLSASESPWQPYEGPHGGHGWKNGDTGEVRYQPDRPGHDGGSGAAPGVVADRATARRAAKVAQALLGMDDEEFLALTPEQRDAASQSLAASPAGLLSLLANYGGMPAADSGNESERMLHGIVAAALSRMQPLPKVALTAKNAKKGVVVNLAEAGPRAKALWASFGRLAHPTDAMTGGGARLVFPPRGVTREQFVEALNDMAPAESVTHEGGEKTYHAHEAFLLGDSDAPDKLWDILPAPVQIPLAAVPAQAKSDTGKAEQYFDPDDVDQYRRIGRDLYLHRPAGMGDVRVVPREKVPEVQGIPRKLLEGVTGEEAYNPPASAEERKKGKAAEQQGKKWAEEARADRRGDAETNRAENEAAHAENVRRYGGRPGKRAWRAFEEARDEIEADLPTSGYLWEHHEEGMTDVEGALNDLSDDDVSAEERREGLQRLARAVTTVAREASTAPPDEETDADRRDEVGALRRLGAAALRAYRGLGGSTRLSLAGPPPGDGWRLSRVWDDDGECWRLAWVQLPPGPRGGVKWRNTDTGKERYSREKPGAIKERIAAKAERSTHEGVHALLPGERVELHEHQKTQARRALASLRKHHGDRTLDRVEDLARKDLEALAKETHAGKRDTLLRRLEAYRLMLGGLQDEEGTGKKPASEEAKPYHARVEMRRETIDGVNMVRPYVDGIPDMEWGKGEYDRANRVFQKLAEESGVHRDYAAEAKVADVPRRLAGEAVAALRKVADGSISANEAKQQAKEVSRQSQIYQDELKNLRWDASEERRKAIEDGARDTEELELAMQWVMHNMPTNAASRKAVLAALDNPGAPKSQPAEAAAKAAEPKQKDVFGGSAAPDLAPPAGGEDAGESATPDKFPPGFEHLADEDVRQAAGTLEAAMDNLDAARKTPGTDDDARAEDAVERAERRYAETVDVAKAKPPADPKEFGRQVREIAAATPTGRFGDNKVFVSHVYREARKRWPAMTLEDFKRRLAEADQGGHVETARADMVEAMDPADVRDSEFERDVYGTTYQKHFVTLPKPSASVPAVTPVQRPASELAAEREEEFAREQEQKAKPPEPGYTGTTGPDALGRVYHWVDGKRVKSPEEVSAALAAADASEKVADAAESQAITDSRDGEQPLMGGTDGGGDGRPASVPPPHERIVTARQHLTATADPGLVPEGLRKHLDAHQIQGVAKAVHALDTHGGFLLADGTGVGKTRQQLAVAKNYADKGQKVLIVTKAEVIKPDWKKGKVTGSFAADSQTMGVDIQLTKGDAALAAGKVHVTTYDRLSAIKDKIGKDTVIIFDESHSLKNWDSARSKHGYAMSKAAGKVMYATATPADKPLHIAYLFRAKIFGTRKWEETYSELGMRQVDVWTGTQTIKKWEIDPRVGAGEVFRRMAGLFDRMTEDGLMLKREISFKGVDIGFDRLGLPAEAHAAMERIAREVDSGDGNEGLKAALTLMHQRRQQEPYKIPHVVDSVRREVAEGRQVVVFASRVNESDVKDASGETIASSEGTAKLLREALEKAGVGGVVELHGGVTAKQRLKAMEDFQAGKGKVIVATVESGGTGINLDDVGGSSPRTLLMMTAPFSAVENVQAAGRVWRLKTKSLPRIRYLFGDTDVDRWNAGLIAGKMKALGAAVAGEISALDVPNLDVSAEAEADRMRAAREAKGPAEPYQWPRLVRTAEEQAAFDESRKPVTIRGDTYPHKETIKAAGGRYENGAWTIPKAGADKIRHLKGLGFSDKPAPATATQEAPPAPPAPPASEYVSPQRKAAIHEALRSLAGSDEDKARDRNSVGFNQMDSDFGHQLAGQSDLTDRQAAAAAAMLHKYKRQLGDELHARVTAREEAPKPPPEQKRGMETRRVATRQGVRHVYNFTPNAAFWNFRRAANPAFVSVRKNDSGDWEASIWGETPEEVEAHAAALRSRGVRLSLMAVDSFAADLAREIREAAG